MRQMPWAARGQREGSARAALSSSALSESLRCHSAKLRSDQATQRPGYAAPAAGPSSASAESAASDLLTLPFRAWRFRPKGGGKFASAVAV